MINVGKIAELGGQGLGLDLLPYALVLRSSTTPPCPVIGENPMAPGVSGSMVRSGAPSPTRYNFREGTSL